MSGFVGILNADGRPVERELLSQLTQSIGYRGPDAQDVWSSGHVGFGHTMLRTTREAEREHQPCTVDGECWIAADCRVDAREDLMRELTALGRGDLKEATDPELILHAYAVWGVDCVQHLLGDFAFAIWDPRSQRLFCARDHMGVKPFYYSHRGGCLVVGNTLNSLRLHPSVSDRLNDLAIGDFLLFGMNQDRETTSFADIRRLPPSHTLLFSGGNLRIDRYWTLPIDPPLRLKRRGDYVEHFLELLRVVVKDRLRTDHVGVLMSGGLDSPALAAIAQEVGGASLDLRAYTVVCDRLIPDKERYYAGLVASHLGIPIHFQVTDDYQFYESCLDRASRSPDPAHILVRGPHPRHKELGSMAESSRVSLYGEGPDNALHYQWKPYVNYELANRKFGNLLRDVISFPFLFRKVPFWTRLTGSVSRRPPAGDCFPQWLNPDFSARLGLRDRYDHILAQEDESKSPHPVRPIAWSSMLHPLWDLMFEEFDPGVRKVPVEIRHPYVDIRMLKYLLAVPVIPWCRGKHLLRHAMKKYLPAQILVRPKEALAGDPEFAKWKQDGVRLDSLAEPPADYVDLALFRQTPSELANVLSINLRAVTLGEFCRTLTLI